MELVVLAVGRLKGPEQELCERYVGRITAIGRQLGFGRCRIVTINEGREGMPVARREAEAKALLVKIPDRALLIALDEQGVQMDSQAFADRLQQFREQAAPALIFVLGGPDGHGKLLLERAALKLSLSSLTLPHGLARVLCCEQIYRALTILANHPYHRQ